MFKDVDCIQIEIALLELLDIEADVYYQLYPREGYVYFNHANPETAVYLDDTCQHSIAQIQQVYYLRKHRLQ